MKKNLIYTMMALLAVFSLTACSEDEGTEPGNDRKPVATVFTYSAEVPYDPDVDCKVRIATNSATQEVYYLAEKTTDYESRLNSGGESGVIDNVVSNGTKAEASVATPIDVVLQNLGGAYTIEVVAANGSTKTLATAEFTGYAWIDVAKGTYTSQYKYASNFGFASVETTLQYKEADPTQYRFKDLFGTGQHLLFNKTSYDSGDGGTLMSVSAQSTPFTYGSYGTLYVRDVATWQGDNSYLVYNILYPTGECQLWLQWYVSAGNTGYGLDYFIPAN